MSTEAAIRSGQYIRWVVMPRRRLGGAPAGPDNYGPPGVTAYFAPISLELAMAPAVARLRLAIVPDELEMPWRWGKVIALDDMIELMGDQASGRVGLFSGFVVEPDWNYQASGGSCIVVAMGRAQRLLADVPVYGRWMKSADDKMFLASGLACDFNADGRPNRSSYHYEGPALGLYKTPVFTYDDDPAAMFWSATDAVRYLLANYNAAGIWLSNPTFTADQLADTAPITALVEGQSLWEALAAVAASGGYDVCEQYSYTAGQVAAAIKYQKRGAGTAYEIRHQATAAVKPAVDLKGTNSFSARVAETVASCITAPVVLGARKLTELSIWLHQIWLPAAIAYDAAADGPLILENDAETNYSRRYVVGGKDFSDYQFIGRRWDANTDRLYPASAYGDFIGLGVDMGYAVDGKADSWPLMPHRPLPLITREEHGSDVVAYWSPDGGTNHYELKGFRVERDGLGIYITQSNLADIRYGDKADKATKNFFAALVADYTKVRVFLRCTVASPTRGLHVASRRTSAGTQFSTARAIDRGQVGGMRTIKPDPNSPWYARCSGAASTDDSGKLSSIAQAVQDAAEDRSIEASLELPWPETAISLGDRVERIAGIDYKLGTNNGAAIRYPRVVRLILNLTPESYDTQICLDTDRQAGVV
jgi:hypothetical protein